MKPILLSNINDSQLSKNYLTKPLKDFLENESIDSLNEILEIIKAKPRFSTEHHLLDSGLLKDFIVNNFNKKNMDFTSPKEICILLAKLIEPTKDSSIYDPACGIGSLLIQMKREANSHVKLYGQERSLFVATLCQVNMHLNHIKDFYIECEDTLFNPLHSKDYVLEQFDYAVSHLPFASKIQPLALQKNRYQRCYWNLLSKNNGDYAFLLHMLSSLKDEGKMGVVVPHGVLFREAHEKEIRKQLVEENLIETIIGLPTNLLPTTNISVCIIIFNKKKSTKNILFIDASQSYVKQKNGVKLNNEIIEEIVSTYKDKKTKEKYSFLANLEKIRENDYNLNIARYINAREEKKIDVKETARNIEKIKTQWLQLQNEIHLCLEEFNVKG
ncbi:N-6 DNA methylase [Helicobacter cetorum]|uniref:site-specific DNA-methyltransferase (adenine-specific) n=1 Tax=Helicobacter cetorum (strain ATCC BAA-429 / MIT 00-7128) TaxID=182217 RepID=I0EML0_HELC0|nr:N-6 DNA methylase [Helicobacter cetorum]AFI04179.1 type I restriction-modification system, M subunit [Helicobacter cetorum MIT 00-7128]